jgi:hypothetical protein
MDIQHLSTEISQQQVLEEAALKVEDMALGTAEQQAADLAKLVESAQAITDPNLGKYLDMEA